LVEKSKVMANKPKSMLQVRRILQLLTGGKSMREIWSQTGISRNTINAYARRFEGSGRRMPLIFRVRMATGVS
jgi:transposase